MHVFIPRVTFSFISNYCSPFTIDKQSGREEGRTNEWTRDKSVDGNFCLNRTLSASLEQKRSEMCSVFCAFFHYFHSKREKGKKKRGKTFTLWSVMMRRKFFATRRFSIDVRPAEWAVEDVTIDNEMKWKSIDFFSSRTKRIISN